MNSCFDEGFSAFSCTACAAPLRRDETAACWPARRPDGSPALLWQVWLDRETLARAWGLAPGAEGPDPDAAARLVAAEMEKQGEWSRQNPGVLLGPQAVTVQPYLLDPDLLELRMLTPWARPLRAAAPGGERDEARVLALGLALCRACRLADGPAVPDPDSVFLDEEGRLLLGPVWPGAGERPAAGFAVQGSGQARRAYGAAMLLFWLLNGGAGPFAGQAADPTDAERRRLGGEALPAAPFAGQGMNELLRRICQVPPGPDCRLDTLEQGLEALAAPRAEEEQRRAEEEAERQAREREEAEQRREEEEQLRRSREKQARRAERDLGTDRGDRRLLGGLLAGAAVLVAAVCLFVALGAVNRLRGSLDAGRWATALEQIEEGRAAGENVDELVELYAEECLQNGEYIRAMAAYDCHSGADPDADQLRRLVELTLQSGEPGRAGRFLASLSEKGGDLGALAAQLQQEYSEELAS